MVKISFFGKKEEQKELLTHFIYQFISKSRRGRTYKMARRNAAQHLENFQKKTGLLVYTDNFTELVAEEFIYYLRSEGRIRRSEKKDANNGLMLNTVKNIFCHIARVLRQAHRRGYKVDLSFENVTPTGEDANAVYLTMDELTRINNLEKLSVEARAARDRFLLGCFTALRYSDYSQLSKKNISGNEITVKTSKTGVKVVIPIHPIVREVLERNGGDFPPLPSHSCFCGTIKRVCKRASIVEPILYERTIGLKLERKRVKKYELVASHTARRTGATNMYLAGIPTARIMLITGHKTEDSFFKYIRIGREENAKTLAEHPFFK